MESICKYKSKDPLNQKDFYSFGNFSEVENKNYGIMVYEIFYLNLWR